MAKTHVVGGVSFPNVGIMVAAGVCKIPETTMEWLKVAPVVSGSYTPEPRAGNQGDRVVYPNTFEEVLEGGFALNSFGMPNPGFERAIEAFDGHSPENPLMVSVAGFSIEDYVRGVEKFSNLENVSAIELNFGCPNVEHGKIISFDLELMRLILSDLRALKRFRNTPIWVKLSPYDPGLLKEVAGLINESEIVSAVVTCNTFPNGYAGADTISPNNGLAGVSGPALKPLALGNVFQFRKHLAPEIDVIGVGGITTGNDVIRFIDAGAAAVQLATLPFYSGEPGEFWEHHLLNPETGNRLIELLEREES